MNGCLSLIEVLLVDLEKDEKEIPHKSGKKTLVDVVKSSSFLGFRQDDKKGDILLLSRIERLPVSWA